MTAMLSPATATTVRSLCWCGRRVLSGSRCRGSPWGLLRRRHLRSCLRCRFSTLLELRTGLLHVRLLELRVGLLLHLGRGTRLLELRPPLLHVRLLHLRVGPDNLVLRGRTSGLGPRLLPVPLR